MRCRTLARSLQVEGARIVFFCRDHKDSLHQQILGNEFEVVNLPRRRWSPLELPQSIYAQWLGCSQSQDTEDCLKACQSSFQFAPNFVISDHYGLDRDWELRIRSIFPDVKLLAIDDLAARPHSVDFLLDSGRVQGWLDRSYESLVEPSCRLLLGPRFALLSSDYCYAKKKIRLRSDLQRVLIFFGGVDQDNYCKLALEALQDHRLLHLEVDVVLADGAAHLSQIREMVSCRGNCTLHVGIPSLAGLVHTADLAIGAAGVHSWERACLGLPALALPVADNQYNLLEALTAAGAVEPLSRDLGVLTVESVTAAVIRLIVDTSRLAAMSLAASRLVDGDGVKRILTAVLGVNGSMRLRPAECSDLELYFWWVNDPAVRQSSLQSSGVTLDSHSQWFIARLASDDVLMRVLMDEKGLPLGQIRFERSSPQATSAVISFSLDQLARGQGVAQELLSLGLDELWRAWGKSIDAVAQVKSSNSASSRMFLRAGFEEQASTMSNVRSFLKSFA